MGMLNQRKCPLQKGAMNDCSSYALYTIGVQTGASQVGFYLTPKPPPVSTKGIPARYDKADSIVNRVNLIDIRTQKKALLNLLIDIGDVENNHPINISTTRERNFLRSSNNLHFSVRGSSGSKRIDWLDAR